MTSVLPVFSKLTPQQQQMMLDYTAIRSVPAGTVVHNGAVECTGFLLVRSGQLRAYMLSAEGREVTICRFFEMDICLFSASCVMPNMQFDIFIEAEKDTEVWIVPACLFQNLMDESIVIANYARNLITSHFSDLMWLMELLSVDVILRYMRR